MSLAAQNREPPVSANPVWQQNLGGEVIGLPVLQAESAVVALKQGDLKSYSIRGNWLWTYSAGSQLTPHVSRSREGTSYICTVKGTLIAVNRVGRELWKLDLGSAITAPVISGWDGRIFIVTGSAVYCRTASGYSLWVRDTGGRMAVKPVLDYQGGIAAVLENNDFVQISHISRLDRFRLAEQPLHLVPLAPVNGKASFFLFYRSGAVDRIYRDENDKLAKETLPALSQTPVAAAGWKDRITVTLGDGSVQLLATPGAEVLWTNTGHETSLEPYWASMQFDERGVYMLSTAGVTGFRASDGRRLWLLRISGQAALPAFSDEGYLYSGGSDRILHAYRIEERKRNLPRSLYGPMPEGSYGLGTPPPSSWTVSGESRYDPRHIRTMRSTIEAAIKNGQTGENEPEYVAYLIEMAGISLSPVYSQVRPQFPVEERAAFVRLLGYLGSRETVPFLAKLFTNDPEPSIKTACCEAIGRIGVDPGGEAIEAYTFLLGPDNANHDPAVLIAAATSTKNLCLFSGPPLSDRGIRFLRSMGASDLPARVKRHAASEVEVLLKW